VLPILLALIAQPAAVPDSLPALRVPSPAPSESPGPDRWLAWDKLWHFSASFVSVGAGYHLCAHRLGFEHAPATGVSIGGTIGLGTSKELLDRCVHRGRFSWKDMACNALGVAAGYLVFIHRY
jgi:uncharacterized protein YfiM (DUF2279 family)